MLIKFPKLVVSTNWNFTVALSEYPADTSLLTIHFFLDSSNKFPLESTPDETNPQLHRFTKTASDPEFAHGEYSYQAIATQDGDDYYIEEGRVHIYPNLAASDDPRGEWTKRYENAKAQFDLLCANPTTQVSVDGIGYTYEDRMKLLALINNLEGRMKIETGQSKKGPKIYYARYSS